MARCKRLYYSETVYHVIVRGNNRQPILQQKSAKKVWLAIMERYRLRLGFTIYAFVVMDNHVHCIVKIGGTHNISRVMQSVLLAFSCWFRRTHDYVGHVWQGRFKSFCIGDERYLRECIEYIHQNPVRARMVDHSEGYFWSSARQYAGLANEDVEGLVMVDRLGQGDTSDQSH